MTWRETGNSTLSTLMNNIVCVLRQTQLSNCSTNRHQRCGIRIMMLYNVLMYLLLCPQHNQQQSTIYGMFMRYACQPTHTNSHSNTAKPLNTQLVFGNSMLGLVPQTNTKCVEQFWHQRGLHNHHQIYKILAIWKRWQIHTHIAPHYGHSGRRLPDSIKTNPSQIHANYDVRHYRR